MKESTNSVVYYTSQTKSNPNVQSYRNNHTFIQTFRFGLVGVLNTAVDFLVFLLLANVWHWNVLLAQTFSYSFGLMNSYMLNRTITFKNHGKPASGELSRFVAVNVVSYTASIVVLSIMGRWLVPNILSKIIVTVVTFTINFTGSKWWVFRSSQFHGESKTS